MRRFATAKPSFSSSAAARRPSAPAFRRQAARYANMSRNDRAVVRRDPAVRHVADEARLARLRARRLRPTDSTRAGRRSFMKNSISSCAAFTPAQADEGGEVAPLVGRIGIPGRVGAALRRSPSSSARTSRYSASRRQHLLLADRRQRDRRRGRHRSRRVRPRPADSRCECARIATCSERYRSERNWSRDSMNTLHLLFLVRALARCAPPIRSRRATRSCPSTNASAWRSSPRD